MPANTPGGFPYPLPTEPVAEGAAAIRSLAEKLPQPLGYAEFAATVAFTNSEAGAAVIVALPAITFTAVPHEFELFIPELNATGAGSLANVWLFDAVGVAAAVSIGMLCNLRNAGPAVGGAPTLARRRLTPSAGPHTYSARGHYAGGASAGQAVAGAGGAGIRFPGYLRVTRL